MIKILLRYGRVGLLLCFVTMCSGSLRAQHTFAERLALFERAQALNDQDSVAGAREQWLTVVQTGYDSLAGAALHKLGVLYYNQTDDETAVRYYRKAIAVRDSVLKGPHNDRAHSRMNASYSYRWLGRLDSAAYFLREATDIYAAVDHPDSLNLLRAYINLTDVASEASDRQLSLSAADLIVDFLPHLGALADERDRFNAYYQCADSYQQFKRYEAALTSIDRAIPLAEAREDAGDLSIAYDLKHIILEGLGRKQGAIRFLNRAIALLEATDPEAGQLGMMYLNRGVSARLAGNFSAAVRDLERAQDFPPGPDAEAFYAWSLTEAYLAAGREEEALQTINRAIDSLASQDASTGDLIGLYGARGDVRYARGQLEESLEDYRRIVVEQDRLRGGLGSADSRLEAGAYQREFLDRVIEITLSKYRETGEEKWLQEAFAASDRARAYSLNAALLADRGSMPRQEVELRKRIAELERLAATDPTKNRLLGSARLQLDRLLHRENFRTTDTTSLDYAGLQRYLAREDADLLQYHLTDSTAYAFLLTADGKLSVRELPPSDSLLRWTEDWRTALEASAYRRKSLRPRGEQAALDRQFLELGRKLAVALLPEGSPDRWRLRPRLIIVPDGSLQFLPFSALPLTNADLPLDYGQLTYLLDKHRLQFAYSARFLDLPSNEKTHELGLLAFAPTFGSGTGNNQRDARGFAGLKPLNFNDDEVRQIAKMTAPTRVFIGREANRENFLTYASRSRIVHLSSHGLVDAADPNLSFVAFTQEGELLETEELLFYNDLYTLPLQAELVVLSACETSLGKLAPGETALSLASAFAAAGARSTLTTLWQVEDAATKEAIVLFYAGLAEGVSRSAALMDAQKNLLKGKDFTHPYYWSALTLHGEAGPLTISTGTSWWAYALVGFLIFVGTWIGWRRLWK